MRKPIITRILNWLGEKAFSLSFRYSISRHRVRHTIRQRYLRIRHTIWSLLWWVKGWGYREVRQVRYGGVQIRIAEWLFDFSQRLYSRGHENLVGHKERLRKLDERVSWLEENDDDISWELHFIRGKLMDHASDLDFLQEKIAFLEENSRRLAEHEHQEVQRALNDELPKPENADIEYIELHDPDLLELS